MKAIFGLLTLVLLGVAFVYLAPDTWKDRVLEGIQNKPIVPDMVKEKAEEVLATPQYKRKKLITNLESELDAIQEETNQGTASSSIAKHIEESRKLIEELKTENQTSSLSNTVTTKLLEDLIKKEFSNKEVMCATSTSQ